jgi:putative hemolysin
MKTKPKERHPARKQEHSRLPLRGLSGLLILGLAAVVWAQGNGGITVDLSSYFWLAILGVLATILVNSVFVAAEVAIGLLRPAHVRALEKEDERKAAIVDDFLNHKGRYIAACFLGSQTMRFWMIILSFIPAPSLAQALQGRWQLSSTGGALVLAFVLISIPVAAINVILGELIPKSYAVIHPVGTILRLKTVVRVFAALFSPISAALTAIANLVTRRFGGKASFAITNQAEEEIKQIVESAQQAGEIEEEEKELLHSVFEFTDTVVREVMTPRVDMDAVPVDSDPAVVIQVIETSGHSRIPVYEDTDDQIVGIVHVKDLLMSLIRKEKDVRLRDLMRPALFVPENKNLHELLKELRTSRGQMAVVQDEFGGTAGIVTIEDIVEELVGDIVDEYDVEESHVVLNGNGYLVDGRVNLYDLNSEIGSHFESDVFDTVGGYVFGLFGRQPQQGEEMESDGYRFTIEETDGRRIHRLHLTPLEESFDDSGQVLSL